MAFDSTKPTMGNNINVDIPALLADMQAIVVSMNTNGTMKIGTGRTYLADYDGDSSNLPTPTAGSEAGCLAIDSDADYAGQSWYHNGTIWKPLQSTRMWRKAATGANSVTPGGAWTEYDTDLSITLKVSSEWGYLITYCLNYIQTAATQMDVRLRRTTAVAADVDYITIVPYGTPDEMVLARSCYYEPPTTEEITIQPQVFVAAGNVDRVAAGAGGGTPTDYLLIQEIPKTL